MVQLALFMSLSRARPESYLAAAIDKYALLQKEGKDRLLFVGGSNVAFGLDSYEMETIVRRTTINLGLHAGLGLCYMLKEVSQGARNGDLVILMPEYEQFFGETAYGELGLEILEVHPHAWRMFNCWGQGIEVAKRIGSYNLTHIQQYLRGWLAHVGTVLDGQREQVLASEYKRELIYERSAFNDKGDMVRHLGMPSRLFDIGHLRGEINPQAIEKVKKTALALRSRGIGFRVVFPAVTKSFWKVNRDAAADVAKELGSLAANTPESSVYDESLFFNSYYHLSEQGRKIRTRELGAMVDRILQSDSLTVPRR